MQDAIFHLTLNVLSDAGGNERPPQGRRLRIDQDIGQDVHAEVDVGVRRVAQHVADAQESLVAVGVLRVDRILAHDLARRRKGRLQHYFRRDFLTVEVAQVFPVEEGQMAIHVAVAVDEDSAVGGVIIAIMKRAVIVLRQGRDHERFAARDVAIGAVGEQAFFDQLRQNPRRGGEGPFHLAIHDAVVRQCARLRIDLVMPALLHHDFRNLVQPRIHDGIHIDMHKVQEVLVVAAGHRVHRPVVHGKGVEERLQRAFQQLDEGLLGRKVPRAAQDRVFEHVGHALVVGRGRAKGDQKDLVVVAVGEIEELGSGLHVLEKPGLGTEFRNIFQPEEFEAVDDSSHLIRQLGPAGRVLCRAICFGADGRRVKAHRDPQDQSHRCHPASFNAPHSCHPTSGYKVTAVDFTVRPL